MPRSKAANRQIREAQRARVLESAKNVFSRLGLSGTIDDVAAEAGISHGLAYRYFASKDELFRALAAEALGSVPRAPQLEVSGTPGQRLEHVISTLMRTRQEQPELHQVLDHVLRQPDTPRDLFVLARRRGQEFRTLLRRLIIEAQATREVAAGDPDQIVVAIEACLDGLAKLAVTQPDRAKRHFPTVEIVMRMAKGEHEARRQMRLSLAE
jgi:AcrR family transcriptional regulator